MGLPALIPPFFVIDALAPTQQHRYRSSVWRLSKSGPGEAQCTIDLRPPPLLDPSIPVEVQVVLNLRLAAREVIYEVILDVGLGCDISGYEKGKEERGGALVPKMAMIAGEGAVVKQWAPYAGQGENTRGPGGFLGLYGVTRLGVILSFGKPDKIHANCTLPTQNGTRLPSFNDPPVAVTLPPKMSSEEHGRGAGLRASSRYNEGQAQRSRLGKKIERLSQEHSHGPPNYFLPPKNENGRAWAWSRPSGVVGAPPTG
ncbi:hypothetical protein FB451DRAFT_1191092 [Mycena latifolia]|nr:hypothetical protein FB451DRAFT_1191092 [Mycena latifolia]